MRRGGGPTISLFSFQDIITSVMGILLFIALLLALQLVHAAVRVQEAAETAPPAEEIQRLERKKAELEEELQRMRQASQDYAQISPEGVAALRRHVEESAERLREIEERTKKEFARGNEEMREGSGELASLKQIDEQLDRDLARVDARLRRVGMMKELTFRVSGFEGSNRYVLDLGPNAWKITRLSPTGEPTPLVEWRGAIAERKSQALRWCDQRDGGDYVFLLVRPSAMREADEILDRLRERGIPRGFEPLGEDQQFRLTSAS
ncbi:MAG: hypothetical protein GYA33_14560 [Thermogutta sp.]|nr:hypothetical protein [Thermogutta sp.]